MENVTTGKEIPCKRPYTLGKRLEQSDRKRAAVLEAAQAQLESGGYLNLTMDSLARESGVTRQTVHNLFKTKAGVLEALFDQLAFDGGMEQMATLMREVMLGGMGPGNSEAVLGGFVSVFTGFWSKNRMLFRRIHGIAASNSDAPEFGAALEARNQRRRMAATRVVQRLERLQQTDGDGGGQQRARKIAALYALTSFEFFDTLMESLGDAQEATAAVKALVRNAMASDL